MRRALAIAIPLLLLACGLTVRGASDDPGDMPDGSVPPSERDGALPDATGDDGAIARDDASLPEAGPDAPPAPRCKGTAGPASILVDTFCVDRTEVTRTHYAAFIAAATGTAGQPSYCAWNNTFGDAPAASDLPATNIDWCDARAYCAWAGKRLCTKAESRSACSSAGRKYPYGSTYTSGRCNDAMAARGTPVAVASLTCTSELGVHDMLGNVWEWIDECTGSNGPNDPCGFNTGGAWNHVYDCDQTAGGFVRRSSASDVGFRCCSDLE